MKIWLSPGLQMTNAKKTALLHPKTLFQGEVFHNLFIFLMNTTHFYSLNNSFNYVVKNIHSKNLFIQQKKQIIHSKNLFIQNNPKLFIQRKYSFKWKMDYRPGLPSSKALSSPPPSPLPTPITSPTTLDMDYPKGDIGNHKVNCLLIHTFTFYQSSIETMEVFFSSPKTLLTVSTIKEPTQSEEILCNKL